MKIRPILSFKLLGTDLSLKQGETYSADHATNQPDWEAKGLIFVIADANDNSILLERGDYEILPEEASPPVPCSTIP